MFKSINTILASLLFCATSFAQEAAVKKNPNTNALTGDLSIGSHLIGGVLVTGSSALNFTFRGGAARDLVFQVDDGTSATTRIFSFVGGRIVTDGTANFEHKLSIDADIGYGVTGFGDNVLSIQQLGASHGQSAIRFLDQSSREFGAIGLGLHSGWQRKMYVEIGNINNISNATYASSFTVTNTIGYTSDGITAGQYDVIRADYDGTITFKKFQSTANFVMTPTGRFLLGGATDDTATAFQLTGGAKISGDVTIGGVLLGSSSSTEPVHVRNSNTAGASAIGFQNSTPATRFAIGYGLASTSAPYTNKAFIISSDDFVWTNGSTTWATFTNNGVLSLAATTTASSTATGALIVGGGIGIGGAAWIGGKIAAGASSAGNGAIDVMGAAYFGGGDRIGLTGVAALTVADSGAGMFRFVKVGVVKIDGQINGTSGTRRFDFVDTDNSSVIPLSLSLAGTGNVTVGGTLKTAAGVTWDLGAANSVSPTAPNRTLKVTVAGVAYYVAAKTTND